MIIELIYFQYKLNSYYFVSYFELRIRAAFINYFGQNADNFKCHGNTLFRAERPSNNNRLIKYRTARLQFIATRGCPCN